MHVCIMIYPIAISSPRSCFLALLRSGITQETIHRIHGWGYERYTSNAGKVRYLETLPPKLALGWSIARWYMSVSGCCTGPAPSIETCKFS